MMDTPTKNIMNISLLNIPFAVVGVTVALGPIFYAMSRTRRAHHEEQLALALAQVEQRRADVEGDPALEYAA